MLIGVPSTIAGDVVREVTAQFTNVAPSARVGGRAKREAKCHEKEATEEHKCLQGGIGGIVAPAVGGLPIDLGLEYDSCGVTKP